MQVEYGAGHCEHVAHGDGHVDAPEARVDLEIVGTVLERTGIMPADLGADASRALQARLQVDQSEQGRRQVEPDQELEEEGAAHAYHLRARRCCLVIGGKF